MKDKIDFSEVQQIVESCWRVAADCKLAGCTEPLVTLVDAIPDGLRLTDTSGNVVQPGTRVYGNVRSTIFWKLLDKLVPSVARIDHQTRLADDADTWKNEEEE